MFRNAIPLTIGILTGAAVAAFLLKQQEAFTLLSGDSTADRGTQARVVDRSGNAELLSVADQLEIFSAVQANTDAGDLRQSLRNAAAAAPSVERDLELNALLVRLSELNPAETARLARELALPPAFVADAYFLWAEHDPDAAIDALPSIASAATRREVSLAMLEIVGHDALGGQRISAALTEGERMSFGLDRLALLAEVSPLDAFREAEALTDPELKRRALMAVGESWAHSDPVRALNEASNLADGNLAQNYRAGIYQVWARVDPDGMASYLESGVSFQTEMVTGLSLLMVSDPERVMRIANNIDATIGPQIAATALGAMAETDPDAAMARAEAMTPGQYRDYAIQSVAAAMARTDPDRALEWARGISPPSPDAVRNAAMAIASANPERALDMLDDTSLGSETSLIFSLLTSQLARDPELAVKMADRLAARDDIQSTSALRNLVGNWMQRDPESALDWVLANGSSLDANALGTAAQAIASRDPQMAIDYLRRIPQEYQASWITQIAGPYGRYDPNAALSWISQYQGQEVYARAMRELINNAAQVDPRIAAAMLAQASGEIQSASASTVALNWARQEPRAAADWAMSLTDEQARRGAMSSAVSRWASSDAAAARRWTLDMRAGEARDQVLTTLVQQVANGGEFDRELIGAFSTDIARRNGVFSSLTMLARSDPERARELLDSEVSDRNLRRQIEETIERQSAQSANVSLTLR